MRLVTRLAPQHLLEVCPLTLSLAGGMLAGTLLAWHPLAQPRPGARAPLRAAQPAGRLVDDATDQPARARARRARMHAVDRVDPDIPF